MLFRSPQPALFRLGLYFWRENPYYGAGGDCGENERDGKMAAIGPFSTQVELKQYLRYSHQNKLEFSRKDRYYDRLQGYDKSIV